MEMMSSPSARLMPRTPMESRPLKTRTSVTAKRMHWPLAVVSSTSSFSEQICTSTMCSPSSSFMAILPPRLTWTKSDSLLRRTVPREVANITSSLSQDASSSGSGMMVVMRSPCLSGSMFTRALPLAFGRGERQAPHLLLVGLALGGEEDHRRVGVGHEQAGDEILVARRHAGAALAAAALRPVGRERHALDVAGMGHGDDHVLAGDQVLVVDDPSPNPRSASCAAWRRRRGSRSARP